MAEQKNLGQIVEAFRIQMAETEKRARRRVVITAVLAVAAIGYMSWLHGQFSKLDAQAITDIAAGEVSARLPELGEQLSDMAIEAAPGLMDRGEEALLSAPSAMRDTVETRLSAKTDALVDQMETKLDTELTRYFAPKLEAVADVAKGDDAPTLDELMQQMRAQYKAKAEGLVAELYVGYAEEVARVNAELANLKEGKGLSRREQMDKEIIEASVALRRHVIEPIEVQEETVRADD